MPTATPKKLRNSTGYVRVTIPLVAAASVVDQTVFTADRAYELVGVEEVHTVAGNDAGAVTLDVKKCTGTQDPSAGTTMLASTFNLKSTANTVVSATLSATTANRKLADGNRVAFDITGTPTSYAGGAVTLVLSPLGA